MVRTLLLWVHIASVAAWLGGNFVQLALRPWFARRSAAVQADWAEAGAALARRYYNVAGTLLAVSGVALVLRGDWSFTNRFVLVGIAVVVIGAVQGVVVFAPQGDHVAALWRAGDERAARSAATRLAGFAVLDTALVLLAMLAMVHRWGT